MATGPKLPRGHAFFRNRSLASAAGQANFSERSVSIQASKLLRQLDRIEPEIAAQLKGKMEAAADEVLADARASVARDTGLTADLIRKRKFEKGFKYKIGVFSKRRRNVAVFLEFGTKKTRPQPFLIPAYRKAKVKFGRELKVAYDRGIELALRAGR